MCYKIRATARWARNIPARICIRKRNQTLTRNIPTPPESSQQGKMSPTTSDHTSEGERSALHQELDSEIQYASRRIIDITRRSDKRGWRWVNQEIKTRPDIGIPEYKDWPNGGLVRQTPIHLADDGHRIAQIMTYIRRKRQKRNKEIRTRSDKHNIKENGKRGL